MMDTRGNHIGNDLHEDGELKTWYITYPFRISKLRNCYTIIHAKNEKEARKQVREIRGSAWAFIYSEEEWNRTQQVKRFNLTEVDLKHPTADELAFD